MCNIVKGIKNVLKEIVEFVKILSFEPLIFLFALSVSFNKVSFIQLVQDKLCVGDFNQSRYYCIHMNDGNLTIEQEAIKSKILVRSSQFTMYNSIISTLPRILWSISIGSWLDKYVHGRKVMIAT